MMRESCTPAAVPSTNLATRLSLAAALYQRRDRLRVVYHPAHLRALPLPHSARLPIRTVSLQSLPTLCDSREPSPADRGVPETRCCHPLDNAPGLLSGTISLPARGCTDAE